jgi:2'-5' RNA ligase
MIAPVPAETGMSPALEARRPLILTLAFDDASQAFFERLRRAHFPPERNFIPAHLTLFHHLPGDREREIDAELAALCSDFAPLSLLVGGLRFLGRGVAYEMDCPPLVAVRARLASVWAKELTPQDRQGFKPHVTIQNKAPPATARALMEELSAGFRPFAVRGEGFLLWRYLGGPWELRARHVFTGGA